MRDRGGSVRALVSVQRIVHSMLGTEKRRALVEMEILPDGFALIRLGALVEGCVCND